MTEREKCEFAANEMGSARDRSKADEKNAPLDGSPPPELLTTCGYCDDGGSSREHSSELMAMLHGTLSNPR